MLTMPRPKFSEPTPLPAASGPIEFAMRDGLGEFTMQVWGRDEFWALPETQRPVSPFQDTTGKHIGVIVRPEIPAAFRVIHADA